MVEVSIAQHLYLRGGPKVQYSVFDVAQHFIARERDQRISTVKLQKLCFYAFGWYSYQTGSALFQERFFAMQKGPVISELLSAHAQQRTITLGDLAPQFQAFETAPQTFDSYTQTILEATWDYYGKFDAWTLVDMTHDEKVWVDAWDSRPDHSRRGDMDQQDIVDYFFHRQARVPEGLQLPDARVSVEDQEFLHSLEALGTSTPPSYYADLQRFFVGAASS